MRRNLKGLFAKTGKTMFILGAVMWVLGAFVQGAWSATHYMPDDFANLQTAMSNMVGGDELIIRDGTYTGTINSIDDAHLPPSGSAAAYTIIRAEHPGEVVFDGETSLNVFRVSNGVRNYITFKGIIWCRSNDYNCVYFNNWDHIKIQQCGFYDAGVNASTSYCGLYIRGGDYILVEDCYVWGEFFYGITFLECTHSIMRRCVARMDIKRSPDSRAGNFTTYSSQDIEIQNCIAIDSANNAYYTPTDGGYAFFGVNTNGGAARVHFRGDIGLKIGYKSGLIETTCVDFTFDDMVVWDTAMGFYDRTEDPSNGVYNHCLFGENNPESGWGAIIGAHTITNSIMTNNNTYGWEYGAPILDYNCFYDNNPNYKDSSKRGTHDYCTENSNTINPRINSLLYLTRIESASDLSAAGSDGGRVGPRILYRIGVDGSLYGETGYNTDSGDSLWPFPHEDIIRAKMRAYNKNGVDGTRGFCADGQTLTKYIWEYLGNPIPPEIYGSNPPAPPAPDTTSSVLQDFENGILWTPGGGQDPTGNGRGWAFLNAGSGAAIAIDATKGANGTHKSLKVTFDSDDPQIYFRSDDKITDHMPEAAGANRMSFYVRFPPDFPIQPLPFRYDTWQLGTFIHDPADWSDTHQATFEADHGIHHYYHRVTIEKAGGGWVKYIVSTQPDQANYSGSTVPPNIPHYFDSFGRFYFHFGPVAGGPEIPRPFTIWIDEIQFYHDDGTVGGEIHVGGENDSGFDGQFFPDSIISAPLSAPNGFRIIQ